MSRVLKMVLGGVLRRHASSSVDVASQAEIEKASKVAAEILEEFFAHRANNHEYFQYLESLAKEGATPGQALIHRDNFFFRTARTMVSAAMHVAKAVDSHHYGALAQSARNISDEGGHGKEDAVHLKLLEDSHNTHARVVFGLGAITIPESAYSPAIIRESLAFREMQERVFRSSYPTMTGCLLAHEALADRMLIRFRESWFDPYKGYYTEPEYKELMRYFDAHRDDGKEGGNVEEQHKEQALSSSAQVIASGGSRAAKLIRNGGLKFLEAQDNLWSGMLRSVEAARHHGQPVVPRLEFLPEGSRPPVIVSSSSAKPLVEPRKEEKGR